MKIHNWSSRREVIAGMLGALPMLRVSAATGEGPVRLAISETMVADVNMNDARAAMLIWIKQMMTDLKIVIEFNPKVFDSTEEIMSRARNGHLDAVALNVLEYRQLVDVLDPTQVIAEGGAIGQESYLLLVKRGNGLENLPNLRGKRLFGFKAPKMCVAGAWLTTILDDAHLGATEQFFGPITWETKVSRVILPVFFGQADACITSKRGFDTMCELNPQVARDLRVVAASPPMVVAFYVFHRNYRSANRDTFIKILADVTNNPAGRQLATLFQFDSLTVRDASCLSTAMSVLDAADRARRRAGGRKA